MPFDYLGAPQITFDKPNLVALTEVLRIGQTHPKWPVAFRWQYSDRCHCAIGLTCKIWDLGDPTLVRTRDLILAFGMPFMAAHRIFFNLRDFSGWMCGVTPQQVACEIDDYLEAYGK